MDAGPVRYVAVIADAVGTHSNDFLRPHGLPLSLAGADWTVRDLVHQQTLSATTQDGRTQLTLDLVTEPTLLLALYKRPPEEISIQHSAGPRLGAELVFRVSVADTAGARLGRVPVACALSGPDGNVRRQWFEAAENELRVPLAAARRRRPVEAQRSGTADRQNRRRDVRGAGGPGAGQRSSDGRSACGRSGPPASVYRPRAREAGDRRAGTTGLVARGPAAG